VGVSKSAVILVSIFFLGVLFLGLIFEWYDGSLDWVM
jgi:NADH:ubiquinone oxidoreductase subunit 3 (subunit A)